MSFECEFSYLNELLADLDCLYWLVWRSYCYCASSMLFASFPYLSACLVECLKLLLVNRDFGGETLVVDQLPQLLDGVFARSRCSQCYNNSQPEPSPVLKLSSQ